MTIAAGFVCSDGVLLASDTLYSSTGMGLKYGPKFWILNHGDVLVAFGGAGSEAGLLRTRDEIDRKLSSGQSLIRVLDIIDSSLQKVSNKLPDHPDWKSHCLIAIRVNGQTLLYENSAGSNMLSPVQQACQCVGYAQSLGWYFAASLFHAGMSIRWAKIVAAHLVKNTKEYVETVGGDTHLVEVPHVGTPRRIENKSEIADLEAYLGPVAQAMTAVLPDETTNEETIRARLLIVKAAIDKAVRSMVIEPPTGGMTFQSGSTSFAYDASQTPLVLRLSATQPPQDSEEK